MILGVLPFIFDYIEWNPSWMSSCFETAYACGILIFFWLLFFLILFPLMLIEFCWEHEDENNDVVERGNVTK